MHLQPGYLTLPRITGSDRYMQKAHLQNAKIGFIINPIRQPLDPNSWTGGFASLSYLSFALAMHMIVSFSGEFARSLGPITQCHVELFGNKKEHTRLRICSFCSSSVKRNYFAAGAASSFFTSAFLAFLAFLAFFTFFAGAFSSF